MLSELKGRSQTTLTSFWIFFDHLPPSIDILYLITGMLRGLKIWWSGVGVGGGVVVGLASSKGMAKISPRFRHSCINVDLDYYLVCESPSVART